MVLKTNIKILEETMKKILTWLLVLLVLPLAGCGTKEKVEKKAGEEFVETILEEGGAEDVDIDGDKITVKGEDGEEVILGGGEWPTSELVKSIPEFKSGKVSAVVDSPDSVMITLESVQEEEVSVYFDTIKKEFSQESYETKMDGLTSLSGKNEAGVGVSLIYADEVMTILVSEALQE